jgi:phospholipase/carboxylesterase
VTSTRTELAGLTTRIVGPADAALTCVLFHGFGAPGDDLVPLAEAFSGPVRFVFPAAPLELGGLYGDSRAWWMIDFARIEADRARGIPTDRRGEVPEGLAEARTQVLALIGELEAKFSIAPDQLVLGGFSQGAMISLDVALHRAAPPAGLVQMSGTAIASAVWLPRMAQLAGVPVMQSHGRQDQILPFQMAEVLRDQLAGAGAIVDWNPFTGGHEIPGAVVAAVAALFDKLAP